MKYLLYGIVRDDGAGLSPESGVSLLTTHGLAAVSSVVEVRERPDIARLLAYERVVQAIHAKRTVIPLRYGCLMENEAQILHFLDDHRQEYDTLLSRLAGMTEMGIRVLCPPHPVSPTAIPKSPGAAYLKSLRSRYPVADTLTPEEEQLADRLAKQFSACTSDHRREVSSSSQGSLVSLYFLTLRTQVPEFRNTARRTTVPACVKVMWSGPWPPYNFVMPASDSVECPLGNPFRDSTSSALGVRSGGGA